MPDLRDSSFGGVTQQKLIASTAVQALAPALAPLAPSSGTGAVPLPG